MNPLLWQNAVAMPVLLAGAYLFREYAYLSSVMGTVAAGLPIWTMVEYRFFARTDPKRLHSEEYLLEQQRLMIQSKSSKNEVDALTLPAGSNPELPLAPNTVSIPDDFAGTTEYDHLGTTHE